MEEITGFDWGQTHREFDDSVELVRAFLEKYKAFPIHRGKRDDGGEDRLAQFINQQRVSYHRGELAQERIEALEKIKDFEWGQTNREFDDRVELVLAFYKKYGEWPRRGGKREDGDEDRLAQFLSKQRGQYHDGQLQEDRIRDMNKIPGFDWGQTYRDFEVSVKLVVDFVEKHGELPKKDGTREGGDEDRLANFLTTQRGYYHDGQLQQDRIENMEAIPNFKWGERRTAGIAKSG